MFCGLLLRFNTFLLSEAFGWSIKVFNSRIAELDGRICIHSEKKTAMMANESNVNTIIKKLHLHSREEKREGSYIGGVLTLPDFSWKSYLTLYIIRVTLNTEFDTACLFSWHGQGFLRWPFIKWSISLWVSIKIKKGVILMSPLKRNTVCCASEYF